MNAFFLTFTLATCLSKNLNPDHINDMSEKEFLKFFHLDPIKDPKELALREKTLKAHEAKIKKVNQQYLNGKKKRFARVNEFADLPNDQVLVQKTGLKGTLRGKAGDASDEIADFCRYGCRSRSVTPESYSAVDKGLVSPVKSQGACGSCVAFANMAAIETCFAKVTGGVISDHSEQQMIDCGYGKNGAGACNGAWLHSYLAWAIGKDAKLAHESAYPYLGTKPKLQCPKLDWHNQGAVVKNYSYSGRINENILKTLVYEHGAVVVSVSVTCKVKCHFRAII